MLILIPFLLFFLTLSQTCPRILVLILGSYPTPWEAFYKQLSLQSACIFLGLATAYTFLTLTKQKRYTFLTIWFLCVLLTTLLITSFYCTVTFGTPISWSLFEKVALQLSEVLPFLITPFSILFILYIVFDLYILISVRRCAEFFCSITTVLSLLLCIFLISRRDIFFHSLSQPTINNTPIVSQGSQILISEGDLTFKPSKRYKRVVVIVVESLSAIHLKQNLILRPENDRESFFPQLEELAGEKGITFLNVLSNATYSDASMYSLFTGCPALDISNNEIFPFQRASVPASNIFSCYHDAGFKTVLLASHRLEFMSMDVFASHVKMDVALGRDQSQILREFPQRPVLSSPPDEALYLQAQALLDAPSTEPSLSVLVTTSSHVPWTDPITLERTTENKIMRYVDSELVKFIHFLLDKDPNDETLVLVIGDHRTTMPIADSEWSRYGATAPYRIGMFAFANSITPREEKQTIIQSDLLRDIDALIAGTVPQPYSYFVHDMQGRGVQPWYQNFFFALSNPTDPKAEIIPLKVQENGEVELLKTSQSEVHLHSFPKECMGG